MGALGFEPAQGIGSGVSSFTSLIDAPSSYSGKALDIVRVNAGATAVEFVSETSDFLTQYTLLAGRSGGQIIKGDTASAGTITVRGTAHATPGLVIINDLGGGLVVGDTTTALAGDDANHAGYVMFRKDTTTTAAISRVRIHNEFSAGITDLIITSKRADTGLYAAITMRSWGTGVDNGATAYDADISSGSVSANLYLRAGSTTGAVRFGVSPGGSGVVVAQFSPISYGQLLIGTTTAIGTESLQLYRTGTSGMTNMWIASNSAGAGTGCQLALYADIATSNIQGRLEAYSNSWSPSPDSSGRTAGHVQLNAQNAATALSLNTVPAIPIIFMTTATDRMRILAGSNTLQGNAGLTIQGGSAASNALTLSSTSHGTKGAVNIGESGCTIGHYGVTAVARPSALTQTYSTADRTHADFTSADLATTAATQTTPWGFASQAQAENIATQFNLLRADVADIKQFVNSLVDDMQSLGLEQ